MSADTNNRVLLSLPSEVRRTILGSGEIVRLERGTILGRTGEITRAVYFPETAVISTLATYRDGSNIEMANVGREACTGINLMLGNTRLMNTNEAQIGGEAFELPAERFGRLKGSEPAFERALFSTAQAVFYQVMVSGACNGAHDARQRLARWLLTMQDRNDGEEMRLTQNFLAHMLGVRRATVTQAALEFQEAGLIDYARGCVRIIDRRGLRAQSCECYDMVREAYERLLPRT